MKKVSVVIPARNEAQYIKQCLESLCALDFPKARYETIVVDNGSTDTTAAIARDLDVKLISLPQEMTIAAVRNRGAAQAAGEILAFLDADCTVASNWLACAERYFNRSDVACFGSSPLIPDNPTWVEKTWYLVRKPKTQVHEKAWQESTNMFIPKDLFHKVGGFNESLTTCEDVDLCYRLAPHGKIISDARIAAIHHRDPKTIKNFFLKEQWRGKSNYRGVLQHGIKMDELPSLLLPIFVSAMWILPLIALIFGAPLFATVLVLTGQAPVLLLSFIKLRPVGNFSDFIRLLLLYNVYFIARASSLFFIKSTR